MTEVSTDTAIENVDAIVNAVNSTLLAEGVYRYLKHEAVLIASAAIVESLAENPIVTDLRLIFFSTADADIFLKHGIFGVRSPSK